MNWYLHTPSNQIKYQMKTAPLMTATRLPLYRWICLKTHHRNTLICSDLPSKHFPTHDAPLFTFFRCAFPFSFIHSSDDHLHSIYPVIYFYALVCHPHRNTARNVLLFSQRDRTYFNQTLGWHHQDQTPVARGCMPRKCANLTPRQERQTYLNNHKFQRLTRRLSSSFFWLTLISYNHIFFKIFTFFHSTA